MTAGERDDLDAVAHVLDLDPAEVDAALAGSDGVCCGEGTRFRLDPGDMVVFTWEMSVPRPVWEKRAVAAGLVPRSGVTKKVRPPTTAYRSSPRRRSRRCCSGWDTSEQLEAGDRGRRGLCRTDRGWKQKTRPLRGRVVCVNDNAPSTRSPRGWLVDLGGDASSDHLL